MAQNNLELQILKDAYNLAPDYIEIKYQTTYSTNNEKQKLLCANERIKMNDYSKFVQFAKTVDQLLSDAEDKIEDAEISFNHLFTQLLPIYSEGDKFKKLHGLLKFYPSQYGYETEEATFKPTLGQVTLIEFWTTKQYPFMAHNLHMLEQNKEKWQDKVEIIEIQVYNQPNIVEKIIIDKQLDKLQHYMLIHRESFKDQIQDPPFVFLLDKQRRIRYKGDPNNINLEEMINKYIEAEVDTDEKNEEKDKEKKLTLLEQEQSKQLKVLVQNQLTEIAKNMHQEKIAFDVELTETNQINRDETKENIEKSQISLSYEAEVDQKQLIEQFLRDVWYKIPEDLRVIKKGRINDVELDKKLIKEKFADAAKQLGLNMSFGYQKIKIFTFVNELGEFSQEEQMNGFAKCQLTQEDFKKWQDLLRKFVESYENYEEQIKFIKSLTDSIKKGSIYPQENYQFKTIDNYHKLDQEIEKISHKPGQVLVIHFWNHWSESCQNEVENNTLLLEKNAKKWGDKLRFVCLSFLVGYECEEFMEGMKKSLEYIEFYFPNEQEQPDSVINGDNQCPHFVVVDKQGKIRVISKDNNLEELINQLLNEEIQEGQELVQEKVYLNQEQMNQIQTLLKSNQVKALLGGFNNQHTFTLKLQFKEEWQEGPEDDVLLKYKKPKLRYFIKKSQLEKLNLFLDQVYAIVGKHNFKIDESFSNAIDIPFPGKGCVVCKKELNDQVQQYYSPFKNEFLCCECAEFDDKTKKGLARYKCTDTLIFINAPLTDLSVIENIDNCRIGTNLKIDDDEEDSQGSVLCSFCENINRGPRYIAVSAKPIGHKGFYEYCSECFEKLKNKDYTEGMVSDSCFIRILFYFGYLDF